MSYLKVVLIKDIRRMLRDPASILLAVSVPLVVGVLLRLVAGGAGSNTPTAHLLIADNDDSLLSGLMVGAFGQGALEEFIRAETVTEESGRVMMDEGKASGLLIIPEDFGTKTFAREPVTLELITNPSQSILPKILEETLNVFADGINGIQNILSYSAGPLLDQLAATDGIPDNQLVSDVSVTMNELGQRAEPYLFPPAIALKTVTLEEESTGGGANFGEIFFPSMFFLALIFAAQSLSDDFWKERLKGTLRRTLAAPQSLGIFFLGKLLSGSLLMVAVSLAALAAGRWLLNIPFGNIPLAAVWATLTGLFMLLLFTLIQLFASSQRAGSMLTIGILFPLVMAGGAFFPFEVMPDWMARFGRWTPNGFALVRLKEILAGNPDPAVLLISAAGLLAVSAVLFGAGLNRLHGFARS